MLGRLVSVSRVVEGRGEVWLLIARQMWRHPVRGMRSDGRIVTGECSQA